MPNSRRELVYSGMVSLVSAALLKCFKTFGSPVIINHGADGHVYAEFKGVKGACTLYTTKLSEYMFSLHIVACNDNMNAIFDQLDDQIKKTLNEPSLFNLVLLQGDQDE